MSENNSNLMVMKRAGLYSHNLLYVKCFNFDALNKLSFEAFTFIFLEVSRGSGSCGPCGLGGVGHGGLGCDGAGHMGRWQGLG